MVTVKFLHFPDETARAPRSGWYITDENSRIVAGTDRFGHQVGAVRAVTALLNAPVPARGRVPAPQPLPARVSCAIG